MMSSIALVWSFRSTEVMRTTGPQSKCGHRCLRTILENIGMHRISLAQASQDALPQVPNRSGVQLAETTEASPENIRSSMPRIARAYAPAALKGDWLYSQKLHAPL